MRLTPGWIAVIAAIVFIWAFNLAFFLTQPATQESAAPVESAEGTAGQPSASDLQEPEEPQAADGQQEPQAPQEPAAEAPAAVASDAQPDLSWRDADFAVDASRQTEWNYEPSDRKVVYLTFDDGPSVNTQAVLDILDRYGCKATFFVIAWDSEYFPMIAEAYRRGHTIGLHSGSHNYAEVYASPEAFFADLAVVSQVVSEQIGYVPCFIRFPGGSSNQVSANYTPGIMSYLTGEVLARGYQYYDWNASSGDGSERTADELVSYACGYSDLPNIVLLCHDSATKQTTVEALPRIIEYYQSLGYSFEAIDRTTMVPHHGVAN